MSFKFTIPLNFSSSPKFLNAYGTRDSELPMDPLNVSSVHKPLVVSIYYM